ncbi:MAG: uroporphyrinogen decarboxylase family protein [Phycisphaerae bacterium]
MAKEMTSHERYKRMYEHREADRVPITDGPWKPTIERWRREGMPEGVDWQDFFGTDWHVYIWGDNSPQYPVKTIEETAEYRTATTAWGATIRNWKHTGGVPEFLDFTITGPDKWREAKKRMVPSRDRIDWATLKANYADWRAKGAWLEGYFWFGFDVSHSWAVGTERFLMALVEQPEWCVDMFNTFLDLDIAIFQMLLDEGYSLDAINWPDDLGFKDHQFMSVPMFRELLKPAMKRAVEWAHSRGLYTRLHSCGNVMPFVPEFVEIGIDCLNPLEVKAGMDPLALKRQYGDRLVLNGGLNAAIWGDFDKFAAEMERLIPALKKGGGYICSSDHSVPESVSLQTFRRTVELAKKLGSYE